MKFFLRLRGFLKYFESIFPSKRRQTYNFGFLDKDPSISFFNGHFYVEASLIYLFFMVLYFQNCTVGSSNLSYDFISSQTSGWDLTSFKMDGEMGTLITHNEDVNCVIFSGCCLQQIPLSHFERFLMNFLGLGLDY